MAVDVSIYTLRTKDGYLSTTAGGTMRSVGTSPYTGSTESGTGSVSRVVRTFGDQRVKGVKIWDSSTIFSYDVSVHGIVDVSADGTFRQDISIGNNIYASNDGTFKNDVSIFGDLYVEGILNGGELTLTDLTVTNDVSIQGNLWVDGEINGGIFGTDISIGGDLFVSGDGTFQQDVSIVGDLYVDGSTYFENVIDLSVYDWHVFRDASIDRDIEVGRYSVFNNDVSIDGDLVITGTINGGLFGSDVSIGGTLFVTGNTDTGGTISQAGDLVATQDWTSTNFPLTTYVDGSLATRDASISENIASVAEANTGIADVSTRVFGLEYQTLTLKTAAYTVALADLNDMLEASGTFTVTLPDSLDAGFRVDIVNIGGGFITLDASDLLTTDGSTVLVSRYAAATAVHKGGGDWYAFGNLSNL